MDYKVSKAKSMLETNVGYRNGTDQTTFVTIIAIKTWVSRKCLNFVT